MWIESTAGIQLVRRKESLSTIMCQIIIFLVLFIIQSQMYFNVRELVFYKLQFIRENSKNIKFLLFWKLQKKKICFLSYNSFLSPIFDHLLATDGVSA